MSHSQLPNFFILGAVKSGTTTLYDMLRAYPEVFLPAQKEPAFFCDEQYFHHGLDWYLETYYTKAASHPLRGDATPRYLMWPEKVAPRLAKIYAEHPPRMILIFRHPVQLAYSYYWQNVREGREPLSFQQALDSETERLAASNEYLAHRGRFTYAYSQIGRFATQIKPFLKAFPNGQFLFLLTEDLRDFTAVARQLETFLGLSPRDWSVPLRSNVASLPRSARLHRWLVQPSWLKNQLKKLLPYTARHRLKQAAIRLNLQAIDPPPLDTDLAKRLQHNYLPEIEELETIIARDLSAWKEVHQPDV